LQAVLTSLGYYNFKDISLVMGKISKYFFLFLLSLAALNFLYRDSLHAEETPKAVFQEAEALFNKKKYSEALSLYEKVVSLDPSHTKGYRGIARCYSELGDPQGAVIYMESLFLENPENAEVCYGLGYSLYNTKKYDDARNYFEKAIKLKPDMASAWNNCAAIYHFITRDYKKARKYYKKAIEISKQTGDDGVLEIARKNMANLPTSEELKPLKEKLTLEEFINNFISRVDENNDKAVRLLVLGQKENCEQALDWFLEQAMRSCVEGKKEDEKTKVDLATLLEKHYRPSFQSDFLQSKLDLYNSLDDEQKKKTVEAEELLKEGIQMEQKGSHEKALNSYKQSSESFKQIGNKNREGLALVYLGDLYRKMKKYTLARDAYSNALTCFIGTRDEEQKALALSSLGITYYLLGEHTDALDFLKRSLKIYHFLKDMGSEKKVQKNIELIKARMKQ
jgi:tetratricopeptide (TPR) repeat protein